MRKNEITFEYKGGRIEIPSTSLLVFIDDTGHEGLSDPNVPFFGFGGCVCPAFHYFQHIHEPWGKLEEHFCENMLPLHAADLKPKEIMDKLPFIGQFFRQGYFGRFASIVSDQAIIDIEDDLYHIMARTTYERIVKLASVLIQTIKIESIDIVFEHSQRTEKLMYDYFSRYNFYIGDTQLPIQRWEMTKSKNMMRGLCVADFIAHTAGASVRSRIKGKCSKINERQDFKDIFKTKNSAMSSFMEITKMTDAKAA